MKHCLSLCALLGVSALVPAQTTVFSTDFDGTLPAAVSPGSATLTGVQGYAGLGPTDSPFGGDFLRSETANVVTLSLTGLPAHDTISLDFLFAAIDSLDGTGTYPAGDFFNASLDGVSFFRESFANATADEIQSYVPPAGGELARRIDLGFSGPGGYYTDSAYDMAIDPRFHGLAHTAPTATFTFVIEGDGVQDITDESWAMDNLRVTVNPVPEPATGLALVPLLGLVTRRRRR